MIYYVLCINGQPLSDVIDVRVDAQLMILMADAGMVKVISHYVWVLFFSPQRVEER